MKINSKHGAMFGLDARIALAIFGALSVITGAALYSAISDAKNVSLVAEFDNVQKAWSQYYLDIGETPKCFNHLYEDAECGAGRVGTEEVVATLTPPTGWQGPYIDSSVFSHSGLKKIGKTGYHFSYSDSEGKIPGKKSVACNDANKICIQYLTINQIGPENLEIAKKLEGKIDGALGTAKTNSNGNFRYQIYGTDDSALSIMYQLGKAS